uniref:cytochrome c oxidase subunit 8C, mitochondrial isoform X2 n=1 Tax=Panthera onca TaxID=9690 RepID=UPI002954EA9C|nr:cytochrome c oxidase subunit 8C, mitochondrial isoform X2 [Panthera onca]
MGGLQIFRPPKHPTWLSSSDSRLLRPVAVLQASSRFASPDAMPRLLVLRLLPRRRVTQLGLQPGRRLARSESRRRQHPKLSVDSAVALVMVFATFLAPSGYVLSNLSDLRRA